MPRVLDLLPDGASIDDGALVLGGVRATELAERFGTPLVVYDEATLRNQARAYRAAAPDALVAYGTKAFPSVAVLQLFAEEGLGADVSTAGELAFALRAGLDGTRLVVHGNNKEDELLRGAAEAGALVVLDSLDELERRAGRGRRALPRPRHAGDRGGHARGGEDRAPRLEVRAAAGRCGRAHPPRPRHARACTSTSGSQLHALRRVADDRRLGRAVRRAAPLGARLDAAARRPRRRARRPARDRGAVVQRSRSSSAASSASSAARGSCSSCRSRSSRSSPAGRSSRGRASRSTRSAA